LVLETEWEERITVKRGKAGQPMMFYPMTALVWRGEVDLGGGTP
jgi:hypothetical protein